MATAARDELHHIASLPLPQPTRLKGVGTAFTTPVPVVHNKLGSAQSKPYQSPIKLPSGTAQPWTPNGPNPTHALYARNDPFTPPRPSTDQRFRSSGTSPPPFPTPKSAPPRASASTGETYPGAVAAVGGIAGTGKGYGSASTTRRGLGRFYQPGQGIQSPIMQALHGGRGRSPAPNTMTASWPTMTEPAWQDTYPASEHGTVYAAGANMGKSTAPSPPSTKAINAKNNNTDTSPSPSKTASMPSSGGKIRAQPPPLSYTEWSSLSQSLTMPNPKARSPSPASSTQHQRQQCTHEQLLEALGGSAMDHASTFGDSMSAGAQSPSQHAQHTAQRELHVSSAHHSMDGALRIPLGSVSMPALYRPRSGSQPARMSPAEEEEAEGEQPPSAASGLKVYHTSSNRQLQAQPHTEDREHDGALLFGLSHSSSLPPGEQLAKPRSRTSTDLWRRRHGDDCNVLQATGSVIFVNGNSSMGSRSATVRESPTRSAPTSKRTTPQGASGSHHRHALPDAQTTPGFPLGQRQLAQAAHLGTAVFGQPSSGPGQKTADSSCAVKGAEGSGIKTATSTGSEPEAGVHGSSMVSDGRREPSISLSGVPPASASSHAAAAAISGGSPGNAAVAAWAGHATGAAVVSIRRRLPPSIGEGEAWEAGSTTASRRETADLPGAMAIGRASTGQAHSCGRHMLDQESPQAGPGIQSFMIAVDAWLVDSPVSSPRQDSVQRLPPGPLLAPSHPGLMTHGSEGSGPAAGVQRRPLPPAPSPPQSGRPSFDDPQPRMLLPEARPEASLPSSHLAQPSASQDSHSQAISAAAAVSRGPGTAGERALSAFVNVQLLRAQQRVESSGGGCGNGAQPVCPRLDINGGSTHNTAVPSPSLSRLPPHASTPIASGLYHTYHSCALSDFSTLSGPGGEMDGQLYPSHSGYAAGHNQRQQLLDAWRLDAHEVTHGSEGLAQGLEGVILGSGSVQRVVARKAGYASARDAHSPSPHGNGLHDVTSASGMRLAPHRADTPSTKHPSGLVVFSNGGGAAGAMHSEQLSVDDSAWGAPRDPLMEDPAFVLHDNPGFHGTMYRTTSQLSTGTLTGHTSLGAQGMRASVSRAYVPAFAAILQERERDGKPPTATHAHAGAVSTAPGRHTSLAYPQSGQDNTSNMAHRASTFGASAATVTATVTTTASGAAAAAGGSPPPIPADSTPSAASFIGTYIDPKEGAAAVPAANKRAPAGPSPHTAPSAYQSQSYQVSPLANGTRALYAAPPLERPSQRLSQAGSKAHSPGQLHALLPAWGSMHSEASSLLSLYDALSPQLSHSGMLQLHSEQLQPTQGDYGTFHHRASSTHGPGTGTGRVSTPPGIRTKGREFCGSSYSQMFQKRKKHGSLSPERVPQQYDGYVHSGPVPQSYGSTGSATGSKDNILLDSWRRVPGHQGSPVPGSAPAGGYMLPGCPADMGTMPAGDAHKSSAAGSSSVASQGPGRHTSVLTGGEPPTTGASAALLQVSSASTGGQTKSARPSDTNSAKRHEVTAAQLMLPRAALTAISKASPQPDGRRSGVVLPQQPVSQTAQSASISSRSCLTMDPSFNSFLQLMSRQGTLHSSSARPGASTSTSARLVSSAANASMQAGMAGPRAVAEAWASNATAMLGSQIPGSNAIGEFAGSVAASNTGINNCTLGSGGDSIINAASSMGGNVGGISAASLQAVVQVPRHPAGMGMKLGSASGMPSPFSNPPMQAPSPTGQDSTLWLSLPLPPQPPPPQQQQQQQPVVQAAHQQPVPMQHLNSEQAEPQHADALPYMQAGVQVHARADAGASTGYMHMDMAAMGPGVLVAALESSLARLQHVRAVATATLEGREPPPPPLIFPPLPPPPIRAQAPAIGADQSALAAPCPAPPSPSQPSAAAPAQPAAVAAQPKLPKPPPLQQQAAVAPQAAPVLAESQPLTRSVVGMAASQSGAVHTVHSIGYGGVVNPATGFIMMPLPPQQQALKDQEQHTMSSQAMWHASLSMGMQSMHTMPPCGMPMYVHAVCADGQSALVPVLTALSQAPALSASPEATSAHARSHEHSGIQSHGLPPTIRHYSHEQLTHATTTFPSSPRIDAATQCTVAFAEGALEHAVVDRASRCSPCADASTQYVLQPLAHVLQDGSEADDDGEDDAVAAISTATAMPTTATADTAAASAGCGLLYASVRSSPGLDLPPCAGLAARSGMRTACASDGLEQPCTPAVRPHEHPLGHVHAAARDDAAGVVAHVAGASMHALPSPAAATGPPTYGFSAEQPSLDTGKRSAAGVPSVSNSRMTHDLAVPAPAAAVGGGLRWEHDLLSPAGTAGSCCVSLALLGGERGMPPKHLAGSQGSSTGSGLCGPAQSPRQQSVRDMSTLTSITGESPTRPLPQKRPPGPMHALLQMAAIGIGGIAGAFLAQQTLKDCTIPPLGIGYQVEGQQASADCTSVGAAGNDGSRGATLAEEEDGQSLGSRRWAAHGSVKVLLKC